MKNKIIQINCIGNKQLHNVISKFKDEIKIIKEKYKNENIHLVSSWSENDCHFCVTYDMNELSKEVGNEIECLLDLLNNKISRQV